MPDIRLPKIDIECRVQYKRPNGEWFTIDEAEEAMLVLEGDLVNLLARWTGWFEARGFDLALRGSRMAIGLCQCCLQHINGQGWGHASDCQYVISKALLGEVNDGSS